MLAQDPDPALHIVTAVIVAHDGERWLAESLQAVRDQNRPVQRVVGVDAGSRDRSGDVLAEFLAPDAIAAAPRGSGFGGAVRAGLELPRLSAPFPGAGPGATEWIWLVHDDCAPAPDALERLLAAAADDPRAAVLGPKLRDWYDRRLLVEAGVTIDGAGRRETGLEPREFDHGQHDGDRQVLAVSSAGMLVRRDVWEALGGFDASLPLFRDDIDFCWRAGAAGHRVLLVTGAVAYHAEAAARRRRRIGAAGDHPRRLDRRNAMFVLLANLPFGGMVGALLRNSLGSLLRVLMYVIAKRPADAYDEAVAITSVYLMPGRLVRARFRRRRNRRRTYSAIRPYLAHGVALRQFTETVVGLLTGGGGAPSSGRHQAVAAGPAEDEESLLADEHGVLRRVLTHPGVLLVLALTAVALVAERSLFSGGTLAGGALPPAAGGAADLWALYLSGAHETGIGSDAAVPPYVGVLALLSTLALGKPWLAVTVLLLGCVPLAGATAYLLAREVLAYRPARLWMAGSYALLPVATGAVAQGRIGTALVHALLPVLGLLASRMLTLPPKRSRRAAWGIALLLAAGTAFVPLLWLLALVGGGVVAVAFGHLGRRLYVSLAIALGVPLLLLLPWSAQLVLHPSQWLLEAGLHDPALSSPPAAAHELLMLSPGGAGAPPWWVTAGFVAASLSALLLLRRRMLVAVGWCMALFGILAAILISRAAVAPYYGGPPAHAWPGVALAFAATAMLLSAGLAAQSLGRMWRDGGLRRFLAAGAAALALTTPVGAAAAWMWQGVDGPLSGDAPDPVPAFLTATTGGAEGVRTLVLSPTGEGPLRYAVLRPGEPRLGTEQVQPDDDARQALETEVAALAAGRAGDEVAALADFGVGHVLVPDPPDGGEEAPTVVDTLDGTPGLTRQMHGEEFALWRLDAPTGRMRLAPPAEDGAGAGTAGGDEDGDGGAGAAGDAQVLTSEADGRVSVPAGPEGRALLLAEPAGAGWTASVDGRELAAETTEAGTAAFTVPASGGDVVVERGAAVRDAWLVVQGVLLALALVLASPGARTAEDAAEERTRAEARPRRPRGRRARGHRRTTGTESAATDTATTDTATTDTGGQPVVDHGDGPGADGRDTGSVPVV
ncbi:glycosyltransferase, partial [Nocardiopsis halophila]|uniref:glycosyltransferase n=1 Tax=Nocardiopsis halophila TaxID=141692 RepID=UPI00037C66BE